MQKTKAWNVRIGGTGSFQYRFSRTVPRHTGNSYSLFTDSSKYSIFKRKPKNHSDMNDRNFLHFHTFSLVLINFIQIRDKTLINKTDVLNKSVP